MWQSHIDLGKHWSSVDEIQPNRMLVTTGLYRFIGHPIYATCFSQRDQSVYAYWKLYCGTERFNWIFLNLPSKGRE